MDTPSLYQPPQLPQAPQQPQGTVEFAQEANGVRTSMKVQGNSSALWWLAFGAVVGVTAGVVGTVVYYENKQ